MTVTLIGSACEAITRIFLIILFKQTIICMASVFDNPEDETIRCYTCVNKTILFNECPDDTIKMHTCVSYTDVLNRKHIEGHQMLYVTFKCATIQYFGK